MSRATRISGIPQIYLQLVLCLCLFGLGTFLAHDVPWHAVCDHAECVVDAHHPVEGESHDLTHSGRVEAAAGGLPAATCIPVACFSHGWSRPPLTPPPK